VNTETLIHKLALDARPVKPLGRPVERFAWWVLVAAAFVVVGVCVIGIRADIAEASTAPVFRLRAVLTLAAAFVAVFSAFSFAVPNKRDRFLESAPAAVVSACFIFLSYLLFGSNDVSPGTGINCFRNILILAVPTGALLYLMLKKGAPLRSGTVGLLAALGAASFANFGTQLICQNDSPLHMLVWHMLPVLALAGVGAIIGTFLFRRGRLSTFFQTDIMDLK
jgi:hypothetical protein